MTANSSAARKHTMVGQKYFKGEGGKRAFGEQTYTKYSKINNNHKSSGGQDCCQGGFRPPPP